MTKVLTWDDVLARTDLIGGDMECIERNVAYRGPLSQMRVSGDIIYFDSLWCARRNPNTGEWKKWRNTPLYVNKTAVTPQDLGHGRVHFSVPFAGVCTLNPKNGNELDPRKVKGLNN